MLYDRTLAAGTSVFSLNPNRGPYDSGIVPSGCTVFVAGIDYSEKGNYIHGRVQLITRDVAVTRHIGGERESAYSDLGPVAEVSHERISLNDLDCGGMTVMTGVHVYFSR